MCLVDSMAIMCWSVLMRMADTLRAASDLCGAGGLEHNGPQGAGEPHRQEHPRCRARRLYAHVEGLQQSGSSFDRR